MNKYNLKILADQFDARILKCVTEKENMVCKFEYISYTIYIFIYIIYKPNIKNLFYIILILII